MQGRPLDTFEERMCLYLSPSLTAIAKSLGWVLAQQLHIVNVVLFLSHFGQVPAVKTFAMGSSDRNTSGCKVALFQESGDLTQRRKRESAPERETGHVRESERERTSKGAEIRQRGHEKKHRI